MGVQLSGTLHPTHIYKMTDCSEYDVQFATEKVKDHKFETTDAGAKSCAGKVEPADTTQYVWDYKNDENKDLGLEVGAVVHNREWSYGLIKYASLVQVAVPFKAKCTFSFRDEGCVRTLKIMDDTGYTHGELDINIHAGTPCVVPSHEKKRSLSKTRSSDAHKNSQTKNQETATNLLRMLYWELYIFFYIRFLLRDGILLWRSPSHIY